MNGASGKDIESVVRVQLKPTHGFAGEGEGECLGERV